MIQSFDTQLQVVLRALNDVIAPALAGAEKHVIEQLQLSMATLAFMKARLPHARRYLRHELESYMALADELVAAAQTDMPAASAALTARIDEGRALLARIDAEDEDFEGLTRHLRSDVAALSATAGSAAVKARIDAIILARSETLLLQPRLWCLPLGFEQKPETLPQPVWQKA